VLVSLQSPWSMLALIWHCAVCSAQCTVPWRGRAWEVASVRVSSICHVTSHLLKTNAKQATMALPPPLAPPLLMPLPLRRCILALCERSPDLPLECFFLILPIICNKCNECPPFARGVAAGQQPCNVAVGPGAVARSGVRNSALRLCRQHRLRVFAGGQRQLLGCSLRVNLG
jgi:hypothetical protein